MMRSKKVVLADPFLIDRVGHCLQYNKSIFKYAGESGYQIKVLANISVAREIKEEIGALPHFSYGFDQNFPLPRVILSRIKPLRFIGDYWNQTRSFYRDLCCIKEKIIIDPQTIIIFPNIGHFQLISLVKWAVRQPFEKMPVISVVLRFTCFSPEKKPTWRAVFYRRAFKIIEKRLSQKFLFFTDSELLADEYGFLTKLPMRIIPIPHALPDNAFSHNNRKVCLYPIRITYLGAARFNKGFHLLPHVFEKLNFSLENNEIEAEIQANTRGPDNQAVKDALARLRRLKVRIYEDCLSDKDYYGLLERAGIVLLPYDLTEYHSQTSGIFAEALAYGKPVIVPQNTWMANQLETYGAGLIFSPGNPQSLCQAVHQAIENCEKLTLLARDRAVLWNKKHTPAEFLRIITESANEE